MIARMAFVGPDPGLARRPVLIAAATVWMLAAFLKGGLAGLAVTAMALTFGWRGTFTGSPAP